jgi:protein-S-isoprenylcysteine O-methyltransferase Ste14
MLLVRAVLAFLALPAMVAGVVPWILLPFDGMRRPGSVLGWPVFLLGLAVLLWTVRDFYVIGKGTLAPWDAPRALVVLGLYRFTRNPMYIGVLCVVAGLSLLTGSLLLAAYSAFLAVSFHIRVVVYEERVLARDFPEEWTAYSGRVNRWLPVRRGA